MANQQDGLGLLPPNIAAIPP